MKQEQLDQLINFIEMFITDCQNDEVHGFTICYIKEEEGKANAMFCARNQADCDRLIEEIHATIQLGSRLNALQ